MLKTNPAVFAVNNTYQIMVPVTRESLFYVKVGENCYYDHSNGIMRSLSNLHRVIVPMEKLDNAGKYTVCVRPLIERKPYFTETEELWEKTFDFYPVPEENIRLYHIADAHSHINSPVRAAKAYGKIDFLVLNGDILDHSGDPEKFDNIYEICSRITGGNIPTVFSRGNHDLRGNYAEAFADYTPNCNGKTYYTFRLGSIWGMVLDCGEDKYDINPEYGYTVSCTPFRKEQTRWLKEVIENSANEYNADDVKTRLIICHVPFFMKRNPPFDVDSDIYAQWCDLLKECISPDLMLCGHTHAYEIIPNEDEKYESKNPCNTVVGSTKTNGIDYLGGAGIEFKKDSIEVTFTDSEGKTLLKNKL